MFAKTKLKCVSLLIKVTFSNKKYLHLAKHEQINALCCTLFCTYIYDAYDDVVSVVKCRETDMPGYSSCLRGWKKNIKSLKIVNNELYCSIEKKNATLCYFNNFHLPHFPIKQSIIDVISLALSVCLQNINFFLRSTY